MVWDDVVLFTNDDITPSFKPGSLNQKNVDDSLIENVKTEIAKRIKFSYLNKWTPTLLDEITNPEVFREPALWYNSHLFAMKEAPREENDLYKQGLYCKKMYESELNIALSFIEFDSTLADSSGLMSGILKT